MPHDLVLAVVENEKSAAEIITLLLREEEKRHGDDCIPITHEVLLAAAGNHWHAADKEIFEILFRERPDSLRNSITPRLLCKVMAKYYDDERAEAIVNLLLAADLPENHRPLVITEAVVELFKPLTISGRIWGDVPDNTGRVSCLRTIMQKRPDTVHFTGLALDAMVSLEDVVLLEELFSQKAVSSRFKIPGHMVEAAASNRRAGTKVVEALLRHRGGEITITERVLVAAAENDGCGPEILEMLLRERGDEIQLTVTVLEAVVNVGLTTDRRMARYHEGQGMEIDPRYKERDKLKLSLLLNHAGSRGGKFGITSTIVDNFPWEDDKLRGALLSKFDRHSIQVTQQVLEKKDVLDQLLTGVQDIHFSKSALQQIELTASPEILAVLFHRAGRKVDSPLRESVLIAAITNRHRSDIMDLVVAQPWEEVTITERVISTGWTTPSKRGYLEILLERLVSPARAASTVSFSPEAVKTMLQNCHPSIIRLWLKAEQGTRDQITPDMLESLAKNTEFGGDILMIFLRSNSLRPIVITDSVINAAIQSTYSPHSRRFLHILLSERPDISLSTSVLTAAAAYCGEPTLWHWILWESGRVANVTEEVIITAMGNPYFADTIMGDLLSRNGVRITGRILEAVIWNKALGLDIIKLLLKERSGDIEITEHVLEAAVCNIEVLKIILDLQDKDEDDTGYVPVTESVLEAAIRWNTNETVVAVLELLLERRGDEIAITEWVLQALFKKRGGDAVIPMLGFLFEQRGDEVTISERLLEAAVSSASAVPILELLLEERPDEVVITERVLEAAVGNDYCAPKIIQLLVDESDNDEIEMTEAVMVAACRNRLRGKETLEIIFNRLSSRQYVITEKILDAAMRNDASVVGLFLDRPGTVSQIHMTTAVLEAAMESGNGHHLWELNRLMERGRMAGNKIYLTEFVLQKCISEGKSNTLTSTGQDIMLQFVRSSPQEIQITEELVALMARVCLPLLLELCEERADEIHISQRVLEEAAAGGGGYGSLDFLERRYSDSGARRAQSRHFDKDYANWVARLFELGNGQGTCQVNDRVVASAALNPENGYRIVKYLIEEHGHQFRVNERILKAAVRNHGWREGLKVLDLLLREREGEDEIYITESLIEAAAKNTYRGKEMVDLLLQHSGGRVRLTDGIAEAATGNEKCGEEILELFRVRVERP
jgi:hypothetical protein